MTQNYNPNRSNRNKTRTTPYVPGSCGNSGSVTGGEWGCLFTWQPIRKQRGPEMGPGAHPSNSLPPARSHLRQVPQPSRTALSVGAQVSKHNKPTESFSPHSRRSGVGEVPYSSASSPFLGPLHTRSVLRRWIHPLPSKVAPLHVPGTLKTQSTSEDQVCEQVRS